ILGPLTGSQRTLEFFNAAVTIANPNKKITLFLSIIRRKILSAIALQMGLGRCIERCSEAGLDIKLLNGSLLTGTLAVITEVMFSILAWVDCDILIVSILNEPLGSFPYVFHMFDHGIILLIIFSFNIVVHSTTFDEYEYSSHTWADKPFLINFSDHVNVNFVFTHHIFYCLFIELGYVCIWVAVVASTLNNIIHL
ncbi:hypothetical protein ACJX0J_026208, partial [Zea mays]